MRKTEMSTDKDLALLRAAVDGGEEEMFALRQSASEVVAALHAFPAEEPAAWLEQIPAAKVTAIFEALAAGLGDAPEEHEIAARSVVFKASEGDLEQLGEAFIVLVAQQVGRELEYFEWVASLPPVAVPLLEELRKEPDAAAALADPMAGILVARGVTPSLFAFTLRALGLLAARAQRRGLLPEGEVTLSLSSGLGTLERPGIVERSRLVDEVRRATAFEPKTAGVLFDWVLALAERRSRLLPSWEVVAASHQWLTMRGIDEPVTDLFSAWKVDDVDEDPIPDLSRHVYAQTLAASAPALGMGSSAAQFETVACEHRKLLGPNAYQTLPDLASAVVSVQLGNFQDALTISEKHSGVGCFGVLGDYSHDLLGSAQTLSGSPSIPVPLDPMLVGIFGDCRPGTVLGSQHESISGVSGSSAKATVRPDAPKSNQASTPVDPERVVW